MRYIIYMIETDKQSIEALIGSNKDIFFKIQVSMKNVVILSIISVHHLSLKSDPTYTRVNSKVPLKKLE